MKHSKSSDGLIMLAIAYISAILFIGVFDFMKEAVLTVIGQKIIKEIRIEMICPLIMRKEMAPTQGNISLYY